MVWIQRLHIVCVACVHVVWVCIDDLSLIVCVRALTDFLTGRVIKTLDEKPRVLQVVWLGRLLGSVRWWGGGCWSGNVHGILRVKLLLLLCRNRTRGTDIVDKLRKNIGQLGGSVSSVRAYLPPIFQFSGVHPRPRM